MGCCGRDVYPWLRLTFDQHQTTEVIGRRLIKIRLRQVKGTRRKILERAKRAPRGDMKRILRTAVLFVSALVACRRRAAGEAAGGEDLRGGGEDSPVSAHQSKNSATTRLWVRRVCGLRIAAVKNSRKRMRPGRRHRHHELAPWEKRCHALADVLDFHEIINTGEKHCGVEALGSEVIGKLTYYERLIVAFANILFRKEILSPPELASKMQEVQARWPSPPAPT
jgi:Nitrile hydratase beta subunit